MPARTLNDTAKALGPLGGEVTMALAQGGAGEGMIGFAGGTRRTTSRLLDGANYPPVRSLFPATHNAEARVPVAALIEVVKRVALVAERTTPVLLSFSADGLVVEAGGTEEARASEAMDATFTGEPLTIGFNPQYLIDGLQNLGAPYARALVRRRVQARGDLARGRGWRGHSRVPLPDHADPGHPLIAPADRHGGGDRCSSVW